MKETHTINIDEGDRQMILLALAHLAVERPGWLYATGLVAAKMDTIELDRPKMFTEFYMLRKMHVSDSLPEDPTNESVSKALNDRWMTADAYRLGQQVTDLTEAIRRHSRKEITDQDLHRVLVAKVAVNTK